MEERESLEMKTVNQGVIKKDAMDIVTGKPLYVDDLAPEECLVVKVLRSPHAHALISDIDVSIAEKVPGIACVLTWKDVPDQRFTVAGQTYPEPSPYDRLILDRRLRYVGDAVAIVAGENEKAVEKALKLIRVKYEVLEPVLDFHRAKDNPVLVHPEENWESLCPVGADNRRNLCAHEVCGEGDIDKVLSECRYVVDETYHTLSNQQAMMETFRAYTFLDEEKRLNVVSSTQVPFHVRRILSRALAFPKSDIRVTKPRVGGGFGAKQTVVAEIYPAIVTLKTGKPAEMVYSRYESQICSNPRHEMEIHVKLGADEQGIIQGMDVYTLSNTGAYGEHGPTTVGLSGHKPIPLYGKTKAFRFAFDVVYTNLISAGAYRGYGAPQGTFAVESAVNELAAKMNMDPVELRLLNMVREGQRMPAYYGEPASSCALDRCMERARKMIGWDEKYPCRDMGNGKVRSVGVAMAMQGSGISGVDVGSAAIRPEDDGKEGYVLSIGAADMGTGCDTVLAQIAAEVLECDADQVRVAPVDTDKSPYDSGSYASSTTYVTGKAVYDACRQFKENMEKGNCEEVTVSNTSPTSPPPFMVGMAEIEIDKETGKITPVDYAAVVDCGTPINPNLARVQTEGGIVQGIGMALYENVQFDRKGRLLNDSFMQYKIPSREDIGKVRVEFESSYEKKGPFGAKSIGEVVINTPAPAIAHAVYNATGIRFRELPITAEKVAMEWMKKDAESDLPGSGKRQPLRRK